MNDEELNIPEQDLCRVFTLPEIARRLKTDQGYVRKLIDQGELRAWRLRAENGHWRVSAKSLMAYLDKRDEQAEIAAEAAIKKTRLRLAR